jgi:hypothetical protein
LIKFFGFFPQNKEKLLKIAEKNKQTVCYCVKLRIALNPFSKKESVSMMNKIFHWTLCFTTVFVVAITAAVYAATPCCTSIISGNSQTYRLVPSIVTEPVTMTGYKKVVETQYIEEYVTTYQTVWETQQRDRRYTVARSVPETSMKERRYTVKHPVEETEYRDTSYHVTRLVPETTEREERYLVSKQVYETQEREILETRHIPVQETTMQERTYTVNRPVTNYVEQTVDRGNYVDSVQVKPGKTYTRLAWHRAEYYDPATGTTRWRLPGFYWTEMEGSPRYEVNKVYQPNYVTQTVPVTNMLQEQRIEQVPVTRTTFREEQIVRTEQVQIPKTVQEEVVRKIPVTSYKQVVEKVEQKTPITVQRIVTEEHVENIPVTTYKTVTEERVEPYEVKVAKVVPVTQKVRKPITVEKWVPYSYTIERKRTVVNRIPIESDITVSPRSTTVGSEYSVDTQPTPAPLEDKNDAKKDPAEDIPTIKK